MSTATETKSPPYIPWKSFESYVSGLKGTTLPHTLDNTVRPATMAGGLWRQLISALHFLSLIDKERIVTPGLKRLVDAHGTPAFPVAVKEIVFPAYKEIIGDLPLENATAGQLKSRFTDNSEAKGQVVSKSVRFFVHVLKTSGIKHSSLFGMRAPSTPGNGRKPQAGNREPTVQREKPGKKSKGAAAKIIELPHHGGDQHWPEGTKPWPLYFRGKPDGWIVVPDDLNADDCAVIEAQLAVLRLYAKTDS
jgi:hypothetical protein